MDLEGLHIIDVELDGNCLFRAVSQQVYRDAERHLEASVVEKEKEKTWHSIRRIAYSTSKLLVGQRGGGNSINRIIDGARHGSHSTGEGLWVNSSSSNASSGSGRSSTLTSSSTTRTSSEDDEAIIADALFRVAMDLEGLHIIDVEPNGNCLFRAVSQQVYGDAERHLEASVVEKEKEKTWHSIRRIAYSTSKLLVGQRGGGNSINPNIDGARHSSHSMGEGVWVNSSSSNASSGSWRSSTLTSSSTTRTSSEDDEAIIADALFRVAMDLEGLHIIDVEPDGNCLFRAVSQQVYGDAERHLEASVVEKTWHSIRI